MRKIAGLIPTNSDELVSSIMLRVTGLKVNSVGQISGIGMNNSVSVADTEQGRFVVRTNVESHLFRYQREAWCYRQLEPTAVLTPQVLGCGILADHSYSVAPFIEESQPVGQELDRIRVWRTLGSYAAILNRVEAPVAGSLESAYFPQSWEEQVAADTELVFKDDLWVREGLLSEGQQRAVREYLLDCAKSPAPLGVSQFDLTLPNAVICAGDYDRIYLLDLEAANIAPVPYYQLACIAADQGVAAPSTKAFFEGYGLTPRELKELAQELNRFTLYRVMRAAAWARDRCPALLPENLKRVESILGDALKCYL